MQGTNGKQDKKVQKRTSQSFASNKRRVGKSWTEQPTRIGLLDNFDNANDTGLALFSIGVVEEGKVSNFHALHTVSSFKVANAVPMGSSVCLVHEVVDGELHLMAFMHAGLRL